MSYRITALSAMALFYWLFSAGKTSADCSVLASQNLMRSGAIGLLSDGSMNPKVIEDAIAIWQQCDNYAVGFPAFKMGAEGTSRRILIRYQRVRHSPGPRKRCGWFTGNTITLFAYVFSINGNLHHCGTLSRNLAHELGHVLGLRDAPDDSACDQHIMSDLDSANRYGRLVQAEECRALERRWSMPLYPVRAAVGRWVEEQGPGTLDAMRRSSPRDPE